MRRSVRGIAIIALSVGISTATGATAASASPVAPVIETEQFVSARASDGPPTLIYPCDQFNDGETMAWDGKLWRCEVVIGGNPQWQWEYIPGGLEA